MQKSISQFFSRLGGPVPGFSATLGVFHLLWGAFFLWAGLGQLALLSVGIGAIFFALALLRRYRDLLLMIQQVLFCCFCLLATIATGMHSGFFLYLLALLTSIFFLSGSQHHFSLPLQLPSLLTLLLILLIHDQLSTHLNGMDASLDYLYFPIFSLNLILTIVIIVASTAMYNQALQAYRDKLRSSNAKLTYLATHDTLTGLENRRSMDELLTLCHAQAERSGIPFSIALGDVDNFKLCNDRHGHAYGDQVLSLLAETMRTSTREGDFVCRWGGEEILILFSATRAASAHTVLLRIQDRIRKADKYPGSPLVEPVTMTFGLCEFQPGQTVADLVQAADEKLYQGKSQGKNCIII